MEFEFRYSKQTEIDRIIHSFANIAIGFYQDLGFLLLDKNPNKPNIPSCIIPNKLSYLTKEIVSELKEDKFDVGNITKSKSLDKFFRSKFSEIELIPDEKIKEIEIKWRKIEKDFLKILDTICPKNPYTKVIINPTLYGVLGGYSLQSKTIYISYRTDQPTEYIISLILRALVQKELLSMSTKDELSLYKNLSWRKKEELVDIFMTKTKLKELYPEYKSTLELLEKNEIHDELIKESNGRYAELGFPANKPLLLCENGEIKLNGECIKTLTNSQNLLLQKFLQEESVVLSNEDIARILWGDNFYEKFSLSAIMKMIHQLRQKLKDAGLQKEVIFTKRGKGYVLVQ